MTTTVMEEVVDSSVFLTFLLPSPQTISPDALSSLMVVSEPRKRWHYCFPSTKIHL